MFEVEIKPHLFDRKRKLIIDPEIITYDDSDWKDIPDTTFRQGEVAAYRFGIEPLNGYAFTIGRRYQIEIQGLNKKVMKIRFISLYGIRNKDLWHKYSRIMNALSCSHHEDIFDRYMELYHKTSSIALLGTQFGSNSVTFGKEEVLYNDLEFREYDTYFALCSKSNPNIYKSYSYLKDWNAAIVYSIAKRIVK